MKNRYSALLLSLILFACGGPKIDPEKYLEDLTAQSMATEEQIDKRLAYKSLADYARGDEKWNVKLGYVNDKPALLKMMSADSRQTTWWIYADTATGKVNFLKEETPKDGKGVRNLFGYSDTALVFSKTGTEAYAPLSANDFRMSAAEVNKLFEEVKKQVEADRPDLSKAANEARRNNAQVFAAGNEPGWSLVINPSKNEIVFTGNYGAESKTFAYNNPEQGPVGESIYEVRLGDDRLKATIASKYCVDDSGKVFPYTVVVQWQGKSLSGCGIILQ